MNNYTKWYDLIKKHLSNYKIDKLQIEKNGIWKKNKKEYSHILPLECGNLNYMCPEAETALSDEEKHSDWNHLNSSQTLCVNFFAPLKYLNDGRLLAVFLSYIVGKKTDIKESCFEYVPKAYSSNFDFYVKDKEDGEYFFEIKYTENGVAKSGGGKNPFNAYCRYYCEDVKDNPSFKRVTKDAFMNKHYQAYRNMVKAKGNSYSIFITMKGNASTYEELQLAVKDLKCKKPANLILLYWEELIDVTIKLFNDNKELKEYYIKLKEKYII